MKKPAPRPYNAPGRRRQAQATRQSILDAARTLFARHGYQATTLKEIARQAKASLPTVYAVFGSKTAILSALIKSGGSDEDIRAMARAAFAEPDSVRRLKLAARVFRSIHEREADLEDLLFQAGSGDPDLAAVWRQSHQQQLSRQTELLTPMGQNQAFEQGLALQTAIETLWAISSPEVYRLLVRERGWSPHRYETWLANSAIKLLLRDP